MKAQTKLSGLVLSLSLLLVSLSLHAEVQWVGDNGFALENKIEIQADTDTVWQALVTRVDSWWPKDHSWWGQTSVFTIDPNAGGCFCERNGQRSAEHMRISFVDPGRVLRMTGGLGPLQGLGMYGAMDWTLNAVGDDPDTPRTEVTLSYRVSGISPDGFADFAPVVDSVQALQLGGLGQFLGQ